MAGAQVTNGADISYASPTDFVLDTNFIGGMKINEKKIWYLKDATFVDSSLSYYQIVYAHNLGYVPATICFQGGQQGVGWQNRVDQIDPSVSADAQNIYLLAGYPFSPATELPVYVIIFAEKVADA